MDESKVLKTPSVPHALQMPCLGRPFQLGMLYDCRDDRLITGVTLWDNRALQDALDSRPHEGVQFSFAAEDTIENKTAMLGVEAGLKLSLLGGLVNVSGSAKYLDDQKSSKQQARVSLKYSMTSRFEQLTMQHLAVDKVQHPNVFENGDATHVVTAVLYGAEAFFVFDREVSRNEKYRDIHGRMTVMIKKLPSISIEGDGMLNLNDNEKGEVDKLQCQFHGDIVLPEYPTTFQEAVKTYKQLPQLLNDGSCPKVPKKVWLYPLCKLDSSAAQLVQEIGTGLVTQTQQLFEELDKLRVQATDLQKSDVYTNFPGIQKQLSQFTEMISEYKVGIAKRVSTILPQIRGGGTEEKKLVEVFEQHHSSPFNQHSLSLWLRGKEQEEKVLQQYLTSLQCHNVQFAFSPGDLDAIIADLDINHVLCFAFKVAGSCCIFLDTMFNYLLASEMSHAQTKPKSWCQNKALINDMKTKAKVFKSFAKANEDSADTKFIVTDLSEENDDMPDEGADILLYSGGPSESYEPPSQPGKPKCSSITHDSIQLTWSKPQYGSKNIQSYTVLYHQEGDSPDQWKEQNSDSEFTTLSKLKAETIYHVKIRAQCEIGMSLDGERSDPIKTEKLPDMRLAIAFKAESECIEHHTGLEIYQLPLTKLAGGAPTKGIAKCCIGNPSYLATQCPEKVLMVVGATGSGKSTLINGMANYILGVEWNDNFRFKLVSNEINQSQAFSQTQSITSYSFPQFEGSPLPYQLTVVDTPGFGDTRGMERDDEITAQIKEFFSLKSGDGIDHIDGIGFVAQSPLVRLTPTQKYIIDSILSVFGKDIASNIFMMTTFADGAYPPVMDAITTHIETSQPPIPLVAKNLKYFKFNNSALFTKPTGVSATGKPGFDEMYWEVGYTSFSDFFANLVHVQPQTLCLTRTVLNEREKLQTLIQGVQEDIRRGMSSIDEMRTEKRALEENEAKIRANKDFTYVVTEQHPKKVPLPSGTYVTNCLKCNRTCHYPCGIPRDKDKRGCAAMDSKGYCKVCDGHCYWDPHHVNNEFRYEFEDVLVKRHYADLEKKYKDAKKGKATAESMILNLKEQVRNTFDKVCQNISKAKKCLECLEEIALKPNPLTEVQYIDLLIKSEKSGATSGWQKRVKCYEKAREMAVIMANAREGKLSLHMNLEALMDDLLKDVPVVQKTKPSGFLAALRPSWL